MKQAISFITLGVSDLARSRDFYKALGWQESNASQPSVAFFQAGGVVFALFGRDMLAEDAGVPAQGSGFQGFTLAHNVGSPEEVDPLIEEAVQAGGKCVMPGTKAPWGGFRGYFSDPDGFLWEVCHNPFCELLDDGTVRVDRP